MGVRAPETASEPTADLLPTAVSPVPTRTHAARGRPAKHPHTLKVTAGQRKVARGGGEDEGFVKHVVPEFQDDPRDADYTPS